MLWRLALVALLLDHAADCCELVSDEVIGGSVVVAADVPCVVMLTACRTAALSVLGAAVLTACRVTVLSVLGATVLFDDSLDSVKNKQKMTGNSFT